MDLKQTQSLVDRVWNETIVPTLSDYIKIPNLSPMFDARWRESGHMERVLALVLEWIRGQAVPGLTAEVLRLPGRTPLLLLEAPGTVPETVLYYGHLDKQPPMEPWADGLGPFKPVIRDGRLYGRGGADDGYAVFASVLSVRAMKAQNAAHPRCVMLIECCEESGSDDLPAYIETIRDRIGRPRLIVCLDSGCASYDQLWGTTSLRGLVMGTLRVELLREGIHSGEGSGLVASSFRVLRQVLSRLEDERTGEIIPKIFHAEIPVDRLRQAETTARALGESIVRALPLHDGVEPVASDPAELLLNRTWRPALSITGQEGMPPLETAGNVLRPFTSVKISLRVPPTKDADALSGALKQILEAEPPYGARVTFEPDKASSGWNAPPLAEWLERSIDRASRAFFGKPACYMGEGGSIPFMDMLGRRFPEAQFLITGVLGPHSNAHGPNEFLDLATAKNLTASVAHVVADVAEARS